MFGNSRQNVDGELVGVRVIDGHELDAGIHQGRNEGQISGQPIKLGDHQLGFVLTARLKRPGEFGPIGVLAALHLDKLADDLPGPAIEVIADCLLLRFSRPSPLRPWRSVLTR